MEDQLKGEGPETVGHLGRMIIVDLYECTNIKLLMSVASITEAMLDAAREAKATIINWFFKEFEPYGVSGAVIIAESHLAIHTWPERNFASIDIYTCGPIDPYIAVRYLIKIFGAGRVYTRELLRGEFPVDANGKVEHKITSDELVAA